MHFWPFVKKTISAKLCKDCVASFHKFEVYVLEWPKNPFFWNVILPGHAPVPLAMEIEQTNFHQNQRLFRGCAKSHNFNKKILFNIWSDISLKKWWTRNQTLQRHFDFDRVQILYN